MSNDIKIITSKTQPERVTYYKEMPILVNVWVEFYNGKRVAHGWGNPDSLGEAGVVSLREAADKIENEIMDINNGHK